MAGLALPSTTLSSDKPVIGFLSGASAEPFRHLADAFRDGLRQAGFVDGDNVSIVYRWADGDYTRLPVYASELVEAGVDVILASGGDRPALAAQAATSTIPIVFAGSDAPVALGLVASLARPGGNITGASLFTSEVEIKKLELLREVVPAASSIGMLVNPNNPTAQSDTEILTKAAESMGFRLFRQPATREDEIEAAFDAFSSQALSGLVIGHDPYFNNQRAQIVGLASALAIPAVYEHRAFVMEGGLMSYGNVIDDNYRIAGTYAGRILNGERPADLPVHQPSTFELVVNLKTAAELGLTFPSTVMVRADVVIE